MKWCVSFFAVLSALLFPPLGACTTSDGDVWSNTHGDTKPDESALKVDPNTGIPYAPTFQFPVEGFDTSDFGFGFGEMNSRFCLKYQNGECIAYGYHAGRDTDVIQTPFGTVVVSTADGIVRLTTDKKYGAYGSDSSQNPNYKGCLLLFEHEFMNGQRVTTLIGHVMCESNEPYDPIAMTGNPPVGTIVRRGQYVGHVNHYWAGAGTGLDWHHIHWGMRKGPFTSDAVGQFVKGYVKKDEFSFDPASQTWTHPDWLDPFVVVAANGDPAMQANANVRRHSSGSLLKDESSAYWVVTSDTEIAHIPPNVMASDRYDANRAVHVLQDEIDCYAKVGDMPSHGPVTAYKRPGSSTVVMAYDATLSRYDVIRWEALLSWGYDAFDVKTDLGLASFFEVGYLDKGFRLLRPGTLIKADEESEVAIVTAQQTRRPIASGDVFEEAGYRWEHVVSVPGAVLTAVAGPRENTAMDLAFIHSCAVPPPCPGGGTCGGGGEPDPGDTPSSVPVGKLLFRYDGPVLPGTNQFQGMWDPPGSDFHDWAPSTFALCPDTTPDDGVLECLLDMPSGTSNFLFTVQLPDGRWWGDWSCAPTGGCGQPIGTVTLTGPNGPIPYQYQNNGQGPDYWNGLVPDIP